MMRSRDDTHQSAQEKNWEPCPILIFYPNRHRCCKPRLNSLVLVEQEKATFFHDWGCCSRLTPNVDCPIMHRISISLATPCTHYAVVNKELTVFEVGTPNHDAFRGPVFFWWGKHSGYGLLHRSEDNSRHVMCTDLHVVEGVSMLSSTRRFFQPWGTPQLPRCTLIKAPT